MPPLLLQDLGLCVVAATALSFLARLLRQPLILAYIGAGLAIGPRALGWVHEEHSIAEISELGLAFLMFIVGLEIDLKQLVRSSRTAAIVGLVQMAGCTLLGWLAGWLLGFRGLPLAYVAMAAAFSSTMIVVKLLSDKSELDTVAGRITLGVLLVQDVIAIVVLAIQPNLADPAIGPVAWSVVKGFALVAATLLAARFVLPLLFQQVAKHPEILLNAAITWCLLVSWAALAAGFSIAMGALIAGVSISTYPYKLDVVARLHSLRDFFVTLFFVALGMQIGVDSPKVLIAALVLSIVVLGSRVLPIVPVLRWLRYDYRTGLLTSLALAQVSEFSLVIVTIGGQQGHLGSELVSVVALALVATATVSTYLIQWNHRIAERGVSLLARLGLVDRQQRESEASGRKEHSVILVGCHRTASSLVPLLAADGKDFLVIDFSPEVHAHLTKMGVPCLYGDISHAETLEAAGVETARVLVSTISDDFLRGTTNLKLLQMLRRMNPQATIVCCAEKVAAAKAMYAAGADYVLLPRHLTALHVRDVLQQIESGTLATTRQAELAALETRAEVVA